MFIIVIFYNPYVYIILNCPPTLPPKNLYYNHVNAQCLLIFLTFRASRMYEDVIKGEGKKFLFQSSSSVCVFPSWLLLSLGIDYCI